MRILRQLSIALTLMIIVIIIGTAGFVLLEKLSLFDSLWLTVITVLTVGYGDTFPKTLAGKIFALAIIPVGIGIVTYAIGTITAGLVEGHFSKSVGRKRMDRKISQLRDHYIICGYGRVGQQVAAQLQAEKVPIVVIDRIWEHPDAHMSSLLYIEGDATGDGILVRAGIEHAAGLAACLPGDADNVFIALTAKGIRPGIQIAARAERPEAEEILIRAGADKVINPSSIGGKRMAMSLLKPASVEYIDTILQSRQQEFSVEEIVISASSDLVNQSIRQVDVREKFGINIVAVKTDRKLHTSPKADYIFREFDTLIVFGSREDLIRFEQAAK
ncbi:potassium channel family protein [Ferviditalea candida]|uniref:Potassium channel protein n=1 Tax=Ferviditalea candida TaxID=3108399 RepID=A0ABU5ZGG1_9BACL|nr:potassium channel protein [Paenibacillaceae bacterium T2]